MKKTLLAALGLAGACVACCSIPIALTLVSGISAASLAAWLVDSQTVPMAIAIIAASVLLAAGFSVWRRRQKSGCADRQTAASCSTAGSNECGCSPAASKTAGA